MLTTLLLILKYIGIVLLGILGFVLFVLLLVLFWPYFYEIKAENSDKLHGHARITFFFHMVSANLMYDDSLNLYIKLFGIRLSGKGKKSDNLNEDTDSNVNIDHDIKSGAKKDIKDDIINDIHNDINEDKENESNCNITDTEVHSDHGNGKSSDKTKDHLTKKHFFAKKKISFSDFINNILNKILIFYNKLKNKMNTLSEKPVQFAEDIADKYIYYEKLLSSNGTKWVIEFLKKEILLLLKHLKPSKATANIKYGSEYPDNTAKMYEMYATIDAFVPIDIEFEPIFNENVFTFKMNIKGSFCLFYVLLHALKIITNKKVKKFIKLVKREE